MYCNECGHKNDKDSKFCIKCGYRLPSVGQKIEKNSIKNKNTLQSNETEYEGRSYWHRLFRARIARGNYFVGHILLYLLIYVGAYIIGYIYGYLFGSTNTSALEGFVTILGFAVFFIMVLSLTVRRAHDIGKSEYYVLWLIVPLVGIFVGLNLLFTKGEDKPNSYGNQPNKKISIKQMLALNE